MFKNLFICVVSMLLGNMLHEYGTTISVMVSYVAYFYAFASAVEPIYALYRRIDAVGVKFNGWKFSFRKILYLVTALLLFNLIVGTAWYVKIIVVLLIITNLYHFIFTNNKNEEGYNEVSEEMDNDPPMTKKDILYGIAGLVIVLLLMFISASNETERKDGNGTSVSVHELSEETEASTIIPASDFILSGNWTNIDSGIIVFRYENNDISDLYIEVHTEVMDDPRTASYTEKIGVNSYGDIIYQDSVPSWYIVNGDNVARVSFTYKGNDDSTAQTIITGTIMSSHFKGDSYIGANINSVDSNSTETESEYSYEYADSETEVYDGDDLEAEGDPEAQIFYRQDYGSNGPSTWNEMCYDAHFTRGVHVDPDTEEEYPMDGAYCPICNGVFVD